jgi:hypothetical protein
LLTGSTIAQNYPPDGEYIKEWLLLGPFFPSSNRTRYFLMDVGGESGVHPQEGDTVTAPDGKPLLWKRFIAKGNSIPVFSFPRSAWECVF